jgi:uncharacterized protein (TIGR02996 family)
MADMMAIVSKAVFEKAAGKAPAVGTQLRMDRYVSANKNLERLANGGKLYLVTVRPPDEALWLVAILDNPTFDGEQWVASKSTTPITDISDLKTKLEFESGKGLSAAKGALGMSLQTPRAVTANDARLLDQAAGVAAPAPVKTGREGFPAAPEGAVHTGQGNRRQLLLQAVVADPDNQDARQVYADALVTANDPRGEFIILDAALDGRLSIRKRETHKRQRDALHAANAKTWWPYNNVRLRTDRGFVVAIAGTLKAINDAAAIFDHEPVTEVEIHGLQGIEGAALLRKASWLPRAHRLILRGKLKDEGFAELVPALANVRALNVTSNRLGPDAVAALGNHLPSCRSLVLTNNKIENAGITGLTKWKHLGKLETLYLGNCGLTAAGVQRLLDGPPLASLGKLALADNKLGNEIGGMFESKARQLPALRHLDLVKTGLQTAGAKPLTRLSQVKKLDLRSNRIDAALVAEDPRITA